MSNLIEYKTHSGLTLSLMLLQGRPYLPVNQRALWFSHDKPDWAVTTEFVKLDIEVGVALVKASVFNQDGKLMATAYKFESRKDFADFIEKADSGAKGRAVAWLGFGTQFCSKEMDEGERLADAPLEVQGPAPAISIPFVRQAAPQLANEPTRPKIDAFAEDGEYVINFGKHKGKTIAQIEPSALSYVNYLESMAQKDGKPLGYNAAKLKEAVTKHFASKEQPRREFNEPSWNEPPLPTEADMPPGWDNESDQIPF